MKKSVLNDDVFYTLMWSRIIPYDKYTAARILPEMAGILCLMENVPNGDPAYVLWVLAGRASDGIKEPDEPDYPEEQEHRSAV